MNGKAHGTATVALAACSLPFALVDARALVVGAGVLSGLLIGPDLDVNGWASGPYRLRRRWKPLGWIWRGYWYSYGIFFRRHGLSHVPIVGTLTRAVWAFLPWLLVWEKFGSAPWVLAGWLLLGLCLSDLLHIMMDREGKWLSRWAS